MAERDTFMNYVGGNWTVASTGKVSQSSNPADLEDVIGDFQASSSQDVENAAGIASDAGRAWGSMSALARGAHLLAAADYLSQNAERYAQAITRECGKAIIEARGEVGRAVALLQYFGVEGSNPVGDVVPSVDPQHPALHKTDTDRRRFAHYALELPFGDSPSGRWHQRWSTAIRSCSNQRRPRRILVF